LKLLIDTHLLLWWLDDSPSLVPQARTLISNPDNAIFLSAVSMWEIWLKVSLGKLRLPNDFESILAGQGFEHLPLTATQARNVAELPWIHRDPFDRMLIAQAKSERLKFVTSDQTLSGYGDCVLVVN